MTELSYRQKNYLRNAVKQLKIRRQIYAFERNIYKLQGPVFPYAEKAYKEYEKISEAIRLLERLIAGELS